MYSPRGTSLRCTVVDQDMLHIPSLQPTADSSRFYQFLIEVVSVS